jgi:hypothetical protein
MRLANDLPSSRFQAVAGALAASVALAGSAQAFSSGPPDDFAGNPPGLSDCTTCHGSFPVNSGDGSLTIEGLPAAYDPGATYDLTVVLSDPEQTRWGFELTVLDGSDGAGELVLIDDTNTQLSELAGRQFVKQTFLGTFPDTPDGPTSWPFQWVAPADIPVVTFYVAGNAANGDGSSGGDYIYTISAELLRNDPTPVAATTWSGIKAQYGR